MASVAEPVDPGRTVSKGIADITIKVPVAKVGQLQGLWLTCLRYICT